MDFAPLGGLIGAAGAPLSQAKGSDADRAQQATGNHERQAANELKADTAAGIGATDGEDQTASERDADGRRLWEKRGGKRPDPVPVAPDAAARQSRDASGDCGNQLDLTA